MAFPPLKILALTGLLSLSGSWHFGYELTCLNPSEFVLKSFINDTLINQDATSQYDPKIYTEDHVRFLWTLIVNLASIGCFLGTLVSWYLLENLGRKKSFYVAILLNTLGTLCCALSYTFFRWQILALGRFIAGNSCNF